MLQELHDGQKKIIARLQARNIELEEELNHLRGKPLGVSIAEDEEEEEDMVNESKFHYREEE